MKRLYTLYTVVLLVAAVLLASITSLLRNAQTCACEQTYMYTSYTEIPMLDPRWANHRYKLRLYRETGYTRQVLPPNGLPAMLIPGNAGSYEQVRSLASETARMAAHARKSGGNGSTTVDMDWYALDLNGELSAFDGYLLSEQTAFALACLKQLRAMYSSSSSSVAAHGPHQHADVLRLPYNLRPQLRFGSSSTGDTAVATGAAAMMLVGHSMGGVIARAAATAAWEDPALGPSSIALLLTLASPHQYPPLMLQPELARFYGGWLARPLPAGLPAVSVHGGAADMQVSTYLTRLPPLSTRWTRSSGSSAAIRTSLGSVHIPGVWLAAGHTQIDWCNQLVRRLSAALLEMHAQQQWRLQHSHRQHEGEHEHGRALLVQRMQRQQAVLELEGLAAEGAAQTMQQQQLQTERLHPVPVAQKLCAGSNASCNPELHVSTAQQWWWLTAGQTSKPLSSSSGVDHQPTAGPPTADPSQHRRSARFQLACPIATTATSRGLHGKQPPQQWQLIDSAAARQNQQQGLVDVGVVLKSVAPAPRTAAEGPAAPAGNARTQRASLTGGGASHPQRQLSSIDQPSVSRRGSAARTLKASTLLQAPGAAAASVLLRQYLVHPSSSATGPAVAAAGTSSSLPPLLLPATTPTDVLLTLTGSCQGPQLQPDWFTHSQQAAKVYMPPQERTLSAHPSVTEAGGSVVFWDAPGAADFAMVVAGATPCASFRVWLQPHQQQQHSWVDVTGQAKLLPVLQDELVSHIRDFDGWSEVIAGKDYLEHAAWALLLSQQQLTAHTAARIAVWLAPASVQHPGAIDTLALKVDGSEEEVVVQKAPAAARLSAQWLPAARRQHQQPDGGASNSSGTTFQAGQGPRLEIGPTAVLQPLVRPVGGAILLQLQPRWRWLIWGLAIKVHATAAISSSAAMSAGQQQQQTGSSSGSSSRSCWHPVAMYSSVWGGEQHVTMLNTTCISCTSTGSRSAVRTAVLHVQQMVKTWLRAGIKASSKPGFASSMSNSVLLSDVQPGSSIRLLLDPTCSYSISLGCDVVDASAQVLLAHANSAAGMAVALLLLVLSHQMSALIRLMTVARHGTPSAASRPGSGTSRAQAQASTAAGMQVRADGCMSGLHHEQELRTPGSPTAGTVRPDLRQLSATALQRLRSRLDGTLGGAPPELQIHHMPPVSKKAGVNASSSVPGSTAATASVGGRPDHQAVAEAGLKSAGISVLESLLAVTSDTRVLVLAAMLAAAASALNSLNPASLWYSSSSSSNNNNGWNQLRLLSSTQSSLVAAVGWLVHQGLGLVGLSQRGDSPSVVGASLLLGVALLFLLLAVWLTVGVKWCLDWCSAAVAAFNRSLTPNPETIAAIAATSNGGAWPHVAASNTGSADGSSCPCALCAAAGAAWAVGRGPSSGGCFGGCSMDAAGCLDSMAATAAAGNSSSTDTMHMGATSAAAALNMDGRAAPATAAPTAVYLSRDVGAGRLGAIVDPLQQHWLQQQQRQQQQQGRPALPWWWKRQCQVQLAILLLLSIANIALGLAGGVVLLFFTWHLPSSSTAAATKVAEMLLGSRAGSRANSRPTSRATSPLPAGMGAAVAMHGSRPSQHSIPGSPRQSIPGAAQLAATGATGIHHQHSMTQQRVHSPTRLGSLASQGSNVHAAQVVAGTASKAIQEQRDVRSDAGLMAAAEDEAEDAYAQSITGASIAGEATALHLKTDALVSPAAASVQDAGTGRGLVHHSACSAQQQQQQQQAMGTQYNWQQQQQQAQLVPQGLLGGHIARLGLPAGQPEATPPAAAAAAPLHSTGGSADLSGAVTVVARHDTAAARAVALHQLTCHMCHAWTLLYGCCCCMLLPSLLAWLQLPFGQQHLSHWLDVLLVLPVLLHCTAIASGTVEALVGYGPATAAEARRIRHATKPGSSMMRAGDVAGTAAGQSRHSGPVDLYKLVVRGASVYMFAAALMCQPVVWLGVVAAVACLMLGGQSAVEAWHRLHGWLHGGGEQDTKAHKQKGT